jgi:hypothetical protein
MRSSTYDLRRRLRKQIDDELTADSKADLGPRLKNLKVLDAIETWRVHPKPHISSIDAFHTALSEAKVRWFQLEKVFRPKYEPINEAEGTMAIMTNETMPDQLLVRWMSDSGFNGQGPAEYMFLFQNVDPEDITNRVGTDKTIHGTGESLNSVFSALLLALLFNPDKVEEIKKVIGELTDPNPLDFNRRLRNWQNWFRKKLKGPVRNLAEEGTPTPPEKDDAIKLVDSTNGIIASINGFYRRFPETPTEWHPLPFPEKYTRARYIGTRHWSEFHLLGPEKQMSRYTRYMINTARRACLAHLNRKLVTALCIVMFTFGTPPNLYRTYVFTFGTPPETFQVPGFCRRGLKGGA